MSDLGWWSDIEEVEGSDPLWTEPETDDGWWDVEDDIYTCPVCKQTTTPVTGTGKIMLIGDYPGDKDDIIRSGPLRAELAFRGLDLKNSSQIRIGYLWMHKPNKNEECLQHSIKHLVEHVQGVTHILLIGKEVIKEMLGYSITEVNGLTMQSKYFTVPVTACYHPNIIFNSLGELRFALDKFVETL